MNVQQYYQLLHLEKKHRDTFLKECEHHSKKILKCLYKLKEEPENKDEIQSLVQSADIIIGSARFLKEKQLERIATMIVKSFTSIKDVRERAYEYNVALLQFSIIVSTGVRRCGNKCTKDL